MNRLIFAAALFLVIFLTSSYLQALAQDEWFCVNEAGKRDGATIWACGAGDGNTEQQARERSLKAAQTEFQQICDMSDDCKQRPHVVEPRRLTCSEVKTGGLINYSSWKCYRLLVVTLGE